MRLDHKKKYFKINVVVNLLQFISFSLALQCFIAGKSYAIDREALLMLQFTLTDHGFDVGNLDGLMGPKTIEAISRFAEKYEMPKDPDALIRSIAFRSASHSARITKEFGMTGLMIEKISQGVGRLLKDPSSVIIRNIIVAESPYGRFFCGEVNGKNSYGGYAGFIEFNSEILFEGVEKFEELNYYIDSQDNTVSFWTCALAIPKLE